MKARHSFFCAQWPWPYDDRGAGEKEKATNLMVKMERELVHQWTSAGRIFAFVGVCLFAAVANAATTWYVTKSGKDANSGKSESAAFLTIQKAIDSAAKGDTILVGKGTYSYIVVPANREPLTIRAMGSVSECIIKGDKNKQKRCATLGTTGTTKIVLEGFTLTEGRVNELCDDRRGAGVAYGTVNNCIITANSSGSLSTAAGAYGCTLNNCTISNNSAGDWTGGIESCVASNCVIKGNSSSYVGAGGASGSTLFDCTISGNKTSSSGGGGGAGSCTLYRCILDSNSSGSVTGSASPGSELDGCKAYDCIIKGNGGSRIMAGSSCYNCTIVSSLASASIWRDCKLYNCIINNTSTGKFTVNGDYNWHVELYNCALNKITLGEYATTKSCITGDPKFKGSSDYGLQPTSPCVNKGSNSYVSTSIDFLKNPRIDNGIVDIGAIEYLSAKAEVKSVVARPRYPWNGKVDLMFAFESTTDAKFNVSLSAKDLVGNTNLTMKTLYKSDGTAANAAKEQLLPGTYNWVWDATADLGSGFVGERVVVEVKAE